MTTKILKNRVLDEYFVLSSTAKVFKRCRIRMSTKYEIRASIKFTMEIFYIEISKFQEK